MSDSPSAWDPNAAEPSATSWDPNAAASSWDPNAATSSAAWDPNAATSSAAWDEPAASSAWDQAASSSVWVDPAAASSAPAGGPAPQASSAPTGGPSTKLPSPYVMPIPHDPSQPPYGGTPDAPAYFFNASLGATDVTCSTTFRNVTQMCCPTEIGIWDTGAGGSSCRMRDVQENKDWMANCTRQVWLDYNPWDRLVSRKSNLRCMPLSEMLDERGKDRRETLRVSVEGQLGCGTLGTFDGRHNFTGQCCQTLGGQPGQHEPVDDSGVPGPYPQSCVGTCTTAYRMSANLASTASRLEIGAALVALAATLAVVV